jgi:hypothetical protein
MLMGQIIIFTVLTTRPPRTALYSLAAKEVIAKSQSLAFVD